MGIVKDIFLCSYPEKPFRWRWEKIRGCLNDGQSIPESVQAAEPRLAETYRFCAELGRQQRLQEVEIPLQTLYFNPSLCSGDLIDACSFQGDQRRHRTRWMVEACILGAMPTSEIADRLKLSPKMLDWYEYLFYDARPFLELPLFMLISDCVFARPDDALDEVPFDELVWKLIAITLGPEALLRLVPEPDEKPHWLSFLRGIESGLVDDVTRRIHEGKISLDNPLARKPWDRLLASMSGLSAAADLWRLRGQKDKIQLSPA
ncbi:MAG: hypothetical protein HZA51_12300 [Planctomycetes bacterium]|nr:hypothetical protein [Planctomycetota bacterium]